MAIYCWGSTPHGELGLGGIPEEEERILTPREMDWNVAPEVENVACGTMHTLLLTKTGQVYSCGNNDHGQLGHTLSRKRPQKIATLQNYSITKVACGVNHSMAVSEWGHLYTWGSNSNGQLGLETDKPINSLPKLVKTLATKHAIQIACGAYHCLVLMNNGELYSWGCNIFGQLGLGNACDKIIKPTLISSLSGIPIAFIQCGSNHSFALSKSGAVFGWGKNLSGQLGLSDQISRHYPTQLKTLRTHGVRYISCGDDFSVFLTLDGGVFTCGAGTYGQLGHGNISNEIVPRKIVELMGTTCTQISCGRRHTLTFVPSRGRIYGFGLGTSGQLGTRVSANSSIPQVVVGPWVSPSGKSLLNANNAVHEELPNLTVKRIFSGGDHSLVCTTEQPKDEVPIDCRIYETTSQILSLNEVIVTECGKFAKDDNVDIDLIILLEIIFKSSACINASFLLDNNQHLCCTTKHSGININLAESAFDNIRKFKSETLKSIIWEGVTTGLLTSLIQSPPDVETLRIYLVLPLYHEFINSKNYEMLHSPFCRAVLALQEIPRKIISIWWANQSTEYYEKLIENFKSVVTHIINFNFNNMRNSDGKKIIKYEPNMVLALRFMVILYRINHLRRKNKLPYEIFYLHDLIDTVDIRMDYLQWATTNSKEFFLCDFAFIFDAKAKTLLLQTDQAVQMHTAMQSATAHSFISMLSNVPQPLEQFVVLNVTRDNIVADTLREIVQYGANDLKKPLKIKFSGEEAEDAGGVRKEFFMLLLKDLLDPKYGMFYEFEESKYFWFSEHSFETEEMYIMIGTICGLAIYNFTIINLPFPLALYKKLLKEDINLTDLNDLSPILAKSMQHLLDYDGSDFTEVFDIYFEITREVFGVSNTVLLKPNGDKIAVTQDNKQEFVDLYIDYIINKSIEKQFAGFSIGFMKVCGGRILKLFQSQELMSVVVGNEDYDWHAFESEAEYKNGYTSGDQTIRWFWEVFHELPLSEKKKFLLYLTGSDRIPILGMKSMKIFIQPVRDDRCLPVAHTCFNLLDLPTYKTKERLKYKLLQAIQQTQGFSIV